MRAPSPSINLTNVGKLVRIAEASSIVTGRWLKGAAKGKSLPSPTALRWFNELPLFGLIVVVWLVLAKPF